RWFLYHIQDIVAMEDRLRACADLHAAGAELLWDAKQHGFSDRQLANIWNTTETELRRVRKAHGVAPVFKLVDTCAAEFEAYTPYYYSTYERPATVVKSEIRNPNPETNPKSEIQKQAATGAGLEHSD